MPSTAVMTSPSSMPARSAADPGTTPATWAPVPDEPGGVPGATCTPRNPVEPMCTVLDERPSMICWAIERAWSIGTAKPSTIVESPAVAPADPAVTTPTTLPASSTTAPPESPGAMAASSWINPVSRLTEPSLSSRTEISWSRARTVPATVLGAPPSPPALPMARTASPTSTVDEDPRGATVRPVASSSRRTATSWVLS